VCWPEANWNALHLRLIYFGREHCAAQRHDPTSCPICKWAAVEPYNRSAALASPLPTALKKRRKMERDGGFQDNDIY